MLTWDEQIGLNFAWFTDGKWIRGCIFRTKVVLFSLSVFNTDWFLSTLPLDLRAFSRRNVRHILPHPPRISKTAPMAGQCTSPMLPVRNLGSFVVNICVLIWFFCVIGFISICVELSRILTKFAKSVWDPIAVRYFFDIAGFCWRYEVRNMFTRLFVLYMGTYDIGFYNKTPFTPTPNCVACKHA